MLPRRAVAVAATPFQKKGKNLEGEKGNLPFC